MPPWFALALSLGGAAHAEEPAAEPAPAVQGGVEAGEANDAAQSGEAAADPAPPGAPAADTGEAPAAEAGEVAAADDDAGWTTLPSSSGDFGSALDALDAPKDRPPSPPASTTAGPSSAPPGPPRVLTRGRVGLRPRIAAAGIVDDDRGVLLGASLTHQWWRMSGAGVRPSGATRLDLGGRVGGARGIDARLVSVHGVWFGPIGLLAGGAARWDRLETDAGGLQAGFTAGPQGRLVARVGKLVPWAAVTWAPVVLGPRSELPLDTPVDEWTGDFGLDLESHPLGLRLSGAVRDTPTLRAWEAGLGLHVQL
jgi:hypothetical protein